MHLDNCEQTDGEWLSKSFSYLLVFAAILTLQVDGFESKQRINLSKSSVHQKIAAKLQTFSFNPV